MKKSAVSFGLVGLTAVTLFTGCLDLQLGGGSTTKSQSTTVGQQLIDLQRAKEQGAITDVEYQSQKAKILNER